MKKLKNSFLFRLDTLVVVIAFGLGIIGYVLQKQHESHEKAEIEKKFKTIRVIGVSKKLSRGEVLSNRDIRVINILASTNTSNILKSNMIQSLVGKKLKIDVIAGDTLTYSMIEGFGGTESVAQKIPIGKRLFTLEIEKSDGPSGILAAGDHVDIIAEMSFKSKGKTVFTLLENVLVSAVDRTLDPGKGEEAKTISFFVNPDDMENLTYAQSKGTFYASLRNPFDESKRKKKTAVNETTFLFSKNIYESADPQVPIKVKK